jgi:hypothetical protein
VILGAVRILARHTLTIGRIMLIRMRVQPANSNAARAVARFVASRGRQLEVHRIQLIVQGIGKHSLFQKRPERSRRGRDDLRAVSIAVEPTE